MRKLHLVLVAGLAASSMRAQAAEDGPIIVTAQKRAQAAGDVGIALSTIDSRALAVQAGARDVETLVRQLPSVRVQSYSPSIVIFNMRGVSQNDYSDAQEGPIAFYEDEVYSSVAGAIAGRAFDLQRIEALRGPQGTLFGRNATGGLIQYVTAKPTDRPEAYATLSIGSHGQFTGEGAVSGALSDKVRARLAVSTDWNDGFIANSAGPRLGDSRFYAARLQLAIDAGPGTITLKLQGLRNDNERSAGYYAHGAAAPDALGLGVFLGPDEDAFGTCGGCDVLGYREPDADPFTVAYNDPVRFDRTLVQTGARYDAQLGGLTLAAFVDYQHLRKDYAEDSDMSPASFLFVSNNQSLDQWTGELRLSRETGALRWLVGASALQIDSLNNYVVDAANSAGLVERYGGTQTTGSVAVFGQGEYDFAPRWTLIAGARFTHDVKRYDFAHNENGVDDLRFNPTTFPGLARRVFDDWSGKLQLDYKPTADILLYVGVDRGTKSGGFSAPAVLPLDPADIGFGPERLTSWSGGLKATIAKGRARLGLAAFHYDYDQYQAFENADGFTLSVHNKDATIDGLELEAEGEPANGLTLGASIALLESRIKNVILPSGDVRDRQMPNAPGFSATARLAYRVALAGGTARFDTNWRYDGDQYLTPFNAQVDLAPSRLIGDLRIAYELSALPVELAFFASNVTDTRYRVFDIDFSQNFGFVQSSYGRPRWIGASVTWRR